MLDERARALLDYVDARDLTCDRGSPNVAAARPAAHFIQQKQFRLAACLRFRRAGISAKGKAANGLVRAAIFSFEELHGRRQQQSR